MWSGVQVAVGLMTSSAASATWFCPAPPALDWQAVVSSSPIAAAPVMGNLDELRNTVASFRMLWVSR